MEIIKIPRMEKEEYDQLVKDSHLCRIAFLGDKFPYIAPFLYVFDGSHMYFLPTKYGRKIEYFKKNPRVSVEVEDYAPDLSRYIFISLQGHLEEVTDKDTKTKIRKGFIDMIEKKNLSTNILAALGFSPDLRPEALIKEERNIVWRLDGVKDIVALKNG